MHRITSNIALVTAYRPRLSLRIAGGIFYISKYVCNNINRPTLSQHGAACATRKRSKNGSIEKGVATTCYNPRFITFLWLRTQPPIFGLPGSCLQRQFPGSLSSLFSKGTPKSVYIAPFPLLTDYPGLYASR